MIAEPTRPTRASPILFAAMEGPAVEALCVCR